MSTSPVPAHEFTRAHGEAARQYVGRCRAAGDTRSPLEQLTEIIGRSQALQLLPLMLDAEASRGDIDIAQILSPKPRPRLRAVDGNE